jgi:transposase InsO family protein
LASEYGRYGYPRITAPLHREGWKVPQKQLKRRRLWLNDGSCVRLRAARRDHVWSYDFMHARPHNGKAFRLLTVIAEYTRECLAIDVERNLTSENVLERRADLFVRRAVPDFIRSDNGPKFVAERVRDWIERVGVKPLFIEPGSPWENGYNESFNGKLRDELLNR